MATVRQKSFAGGELAPTLYGQTDMPKYANGLKLMRNFFPSRQGSAVSRPGTTLCGAVKNSSAGKVRLVPFVYSNTASYVLEFGNNYIRFWKNGVVIGAPFEVVTPYVTADLPKLKYAQQGNTLTITHSKYPPAELVWSGTDTGWTYGAISFALPFPGTGSPVTNTHVLNAPYIYGPLSVLPDSWSGAATYAAGAIVAMGGGSGIGGIGAGLTIRYYASLQGSNTNHNPQTDTAASSWWVETSNNVPMQWQWAVTAIIQLPSGVMVETLPYYVTQHSDDGGSTFSNLPIQMICNPNQPISIFYQSNVGSAGVGTSTYALWGVRIYKGIWQSYTGLTQGGAKMGLIGAVAFPGPVTGSQTSGIFTDNGLVPDYTQSPPQGLNPFTPAGQRAIFHVNTFNNNSNDYPSVVQFFEQRRIFAGTPTRPEFLFCSASDSFYNFDDPPLLAQDSPIFFNLASRKMEEIRGLVSVGPKLIAATASSLWAIGGSNGPLASDDIDAKRQGEVGSSWVDPLVADGSLLVIRSKGTGIRALTEDYLRQAYTDSDLSIFALHLFAGHTIVDWAYAEDPWNLVWAIRDDGLLLSCAYLKEQEILAWSWHDSPQGGGVFENVCTVPEGVEDAVYFVVNRTINGVTVRNIERMASRVVTSPSSQITCTDCSSSFTFGSPTTSITGLGALAGCTVWAVADGSVQGPFTVSNTGTITLTTAASNVVVGLGYTPQLRLLDLYLGQAIEAKTMEKIVNRVGIEVDSTRGLFFGPDFNNLVEWDQRSVADAYSAMQLESKLFRRYILGEWGTQADVCIQQNYPLPVTVMSVTREAALGDPS